MLRPELQDAQVFADTIKVMTETHQRVAKAYLADGTIAGAVPPLRALIEIMANGQSAEGWTINDEDFRRLFDRDVVLTSDWYIARLKAKRAAALARAEAGLSSIERFATTPGNEEPSARLGIDDRIKFARSEVDRFMSDDYWQQIIGTTGGEATELLELGLMCNNPALCQSVDGAE